VWLGFKRVPKKEQHVNKSVGNACPKLLVTTEWPAAQAFNIEASVFMNNSTSGAGAHQNVIVQFIAMVH